jgi:hypothetical protein
VRTGTIAGELHAWNYVARTLSFPGVLDVT